MTTWDFILTAIWQLFTLFFGMVMSVLAVCYLFCLVTGYVPKRFR